MKNIFYLSLLMLLFVTSCDDPGRDTLLPSDTALVELTAATTVTGTKGFLYLRENNGVPKPSGFEVTLTGQQRTSPTNIVFAIDGSSTAIEGVHYSVSSTTVTIAANASTAELPIMILADNIEAGELWTIVVNLVSADVEISSLYDQATYEVQITCESAIAGTYEAVSVGTSTDPAALGQRNVTVDITLTDKGGGVYEVSDFSGGLYCDWYCVPYGYNDANSTADIQDVCGTITLLRTTEPYGNTLMGTGTIDGNTGVITFDWSNGWGDVGSSTWTPK